MREVTKGLLFQRVHVPGRVANAGHTGQTGSDRIEFVRLDRQADKGCNDFSLFFSIDHIGLTG